MFDECKWPSKFSLLLKLINSLEVRKLNSGLPHVIARETVWITTSRLTKSTYDPTAAADRRIPVT